MKKLTGLFLCALYCQHTFGYNCTSYLRNDYWLFGGFYGESWLGLNNNNFTVNNGSPQPPPNNVDLYTINNPNNSGTWGLYLGAKWLTDKIYFPSFIGAIRYQHYNPTKIKGQIEQYSLPDFTNYNYSITFNTTALTLFGKLAIYDYYRWSPYISAGIGITKNHVSKYNEEAVSGITPRISPAFQSNSNNNVTYTLGLGLDFNMDESLIFSLGYEYARFGSISSGNGTGENWTNDSLSLGNLYSQAVVLSVFYQIPV